MGENVFDGCTNLTSVDIKSTVLNNTGAFIFRDCNKLTTVGLPYNLSKIPDNMFRNANYLKKIELPESVTEIGSSAFFGMHSTYKPNYT